MLNLLYQRLINVPAALHGPDHLKQRLGAHWPSHVTRENRLGRDAALVVKDAVGIVARDNDRAVNLNAEPETVTLGITPHGLRGLGKGSIHSGAGTHGPNGNVGTAAEGELRTGEGVDLGLGVEDADAVADVEAKDEAAAELGEDK